MAAELSDTNTGQDTTEEHSDSTVGQAQSAAVNVGRKSGFKEGMTVVADTNVGRGERAPMFLSLRTDVNIGGLRDASTD